MRHWPLLPHFCPTRDLQPSRLYVARASRVAARLVASLAPVTKPSRGDGIETESAGGCPRNGSPTIRSMAESSLDAALDSLIKAISGRDLDKTLAGLSFLTGPTVLGSEEGESAHGREAVQAFFTRIYDRPQGFRFEFPQRRWIDHGDVAWMVADGTVIEPAEEAAKPYRLTAVLVREGATWRLSLWSGAEPVRARSRSS